jgi:hypothetical protein
VTEVEVRTVLMVRRSDRSMIVRAVWAISSVVALFVCSHGQAHAHANAGIDSIDVIRSNEGTRIGLETTVGYLRSRDGEKYRWTCHETVTQGDAVMTPRYTESAQGVVLVTVGDLDQARQIDESMYRTEDGCNWSAPEGLTDNQIVAVAFDPNDEMNVIAATGNDDGANRVYRSVDAGLSWSETDLVFEDREFRTIRFSRGPAGALWVTAVRHETEEAWVYRSPDGGVSWSEHPVEVQSADGLDVFVDVLVADFEDPNTAWVVMGPFLDDRLLKTTDGGASFAEVYAFDGDIIDGAQDADGGIWLVTNEGSVVHGPAGGEFASVDGAPQSVGIQADGNQIILATRVAGERTTMATSTDGRTFEAVDVFAVTTGPPVCSPQSDSAQICTSLWWDLWERIASDGDEDTGLVGDTASSNPLATDTGCCSGNAKHSSVGLVFLTLFGIGRRRSQGSHPAGVTPP